MKQILRLAQAYPHLWHHEMMKLPDGWFEITEKLLADLHDIQPPIDCVYGSPLPLLIKKGAGFAVAFVSPNPELSSWTPEKAMAVMTTLIRFNAATAEACEACGQPSVTIVKYQDGRPQETLCRRHADEALEKANG